MYIFKNLTALKKEANEIVKIDMGENAISDQGVMYLCPSIKACKYLKELVEIAYICIKSQHKPKYYTIYLFYLIVFLCVKQELEQQLDYRVRCPTGVGEYS